MKSTITEEIRNFKRMIGEATDSSNSGSYEQPLSFDMDRPTTTCPNTGQQLVGTEVSPNAPVISVVDVTKGVVPMNQPTSYDGNTNSSTQPGFDDMPYLSSHPSGWTFDGDEESMLQSHGIQRPVDSSMVGDEDEEAMSLAFDELDDDTDVFQELKMFSETRLLGWK
jgi:hypothetical protein|tara:strand:- start:2298 stop:2798 length:501 start_codon:yes stop_codon:yes gene_type:complete